MGVVVDAVAEEIEDRAAWQSICNDRVRRRLAAHRLSPAFLFLSLELSPSSVA
jgi:hypothetical protein